MWLWLNASIYTKEGNILTKKLEEDKNIFYDICIIGLTDTLSRRAGWSQQSDVN
jgi:hypothetical protein